MRNIITTIKTAFYYFSRARSYALLNIVGLIIGISLFVLISTLLNYEYSYDGFHPNKEKIIQVCEKDLKSGESNVYTGLPLPMTLKNNFPEAKYVTGVYKMVYESSIIKYQNLEYTGFTGASVDRDIFSIFDYRLLLGDVKSALKTADNIAVSKSLSLKMFGSENPVGKTISLGDYSFTISHMYADLPNNSSVKFDILFSDKIREKLDPDFPRAWWNGGILTYVILQDNYTVSEFNQKLKTIPDKYYPDFLKGRSTYFTMPFTKVHNTTSLLNFDYPAVSNTYLFLLGTISFIILLIACVNYVNLTLARASKLNIDAGIRRIIGAGSKQIISIQIWYSLITIFIAFIISIPLSKFCLPLFEKLAERPLSGQINSINVWLFTLGAISVVALISGYIPGKLFSKVDPIKIIKSKGTSTKTYSGVRSGLLVFQFSLTIALIISQLVIIKQIFFMKNADLGFNNNNLVSVNLNAVSANQEEKYTKSCLYRDELIKNGSQFGLSEGTITENIPGFYYQNSFTVNPVNAKVDECLVVSTAVDENFSKVFKIDIVKGRFFSDKYNSDRQAFIINETAMKRFGWNDADGKYIKLGYEPGSSPVVGVMKDIHITTLKEPISPMIYRFGQYNNFPAFLTFRILHGEENKVVAFMKSKWATIFPNDPFDYLNVKDTYYKNYEEEQRLSKIVGTFAVLAIALSIFGLFGLIIFYSENRIKEIGIRKVNGARISELLIMLNADFMKWIVIAFFIAVPFAWFIMFRWLENFAYKTTLSWWLFALSGVIIVLIVILTVSVQSYKAATRNPIEALRYE